MKTVNLVSLALGTAACVASYGCGNGSPASMAMAPPPPSMTPPPPMQPVPMSYTTADILAKARVQSETGDPFTVNGGLVELSPSDDQTSDPMAVNQ